jgi:cellulose synthase/poly-beta-1,6-N-acetylglucosamine synthase-like glycosyltransferase/SAM-dependent methyltransferase
MAGITLVVVIGVVILVQLLGVSIYVRWFRTFQLPEASDSELPKAAIILSIRGTAPFLLECLTKLAEQNYPNYKIHLVVDHPTDPANEIIGRWLETRPPRPVSIEFLEEPSPKAYLKTSAVLQATRSLADDVEVAVLADADTIAYPNWLRDLIIPQLTPEVGLVTGNRWYDPTANSAGALCRFFYNAICVAPMYFMGATWGGSMSMKREVFDSDYFPEKMTDTPCEDAAMQAAAKHVNLKLSVQPNVMMFNREPCTLRQSLDFIKRQLLWTRLYHPTWHLLLGGTWAMHILFAGTLLSGVFHLTTGNTIAGTSLLLALGAQILSSVIAAEWLHKVISARIEREQGYKLPVINWTARVRMLLMLPFSFVVMCYAMLAAAFSRQVTWSHITYDIVPAGPTRSIPPGGLRMRQYRPWIAGSAQFASVDPLIPPLRDSRFLIDTIQEITGKDRDEIAGRFKSEHHDLGGNVRRALAAAMIEPHEYGPALERFYATTDAFLYETLVWNRSPLKNDMRRWIGKHLANSSNSPLRILSFGDGLGIDAYYLAELGHKVTYFDVSQPCATFAKRIFQHGQFNITMITDPQELSSNYFDVVLCLDVLEHVPDPPALVNWLTGLLREGGELIAHAPFFFIDPCVATHLRSNQRYSGDLESLYSLHGLKPVTGRFFWDPIVFHKSNDNRSSHLPWRMRLGGALLRIGSVWSWPHSLLSKTFIGEKELAAMADVDFYNDSPT